MGGGALRYDCGGHRPGSARVRHSGATRAIGKERVTVRLILRKATLLVMLLGFTAVVAACDNTIRGVGRDIQETGDALEDATR